MRRIVPLVCFVLAQVALPAWAGSVGPAAQWSLIPAPSHTVAQTGAVLVKGKIYLPGGVGPGSVYFDKMQIYTVSSQTWKVDKQIMPSGAESQSAVCTDRSKVYVLGGVTSNGILLSSMQIFDPKAPRGSRWSTGPAMNIPGKGVLTDRDGGCAWVGGKLYVFGGEGRLNGNDATRKATYVFDPGTGKWADSGFDMKVAKETFGYASNRKAAYAVGGESETGRYLQDAEKFTPAGGWHAIAKLPQPSGAPKGTGVLAPGLGFLSGSLAVFGGLAKGGPNPVQDRTLLCALPCNPAHTWSNANKNLIDAREEFGSASGGSTPTLYAIGGFGKITWLSTAEQTT